MDSEHLKLAKGVANQFALRPEVEAVALGGSLNCGHTDAASDIDLYVYTRSDIPLNVRIEIMERSGGASHASMGLNFWGPGDEWFDAATGIEIDVVYFDILWMKDQIKRVISGYQASLGYSTCFWFTLRNSQIYYDLKGWFASLKEICQQEYPEKLRQNIISHNHPVLREIIPSYFFQLEKAVQRRDLVSINHRLAGLLASYFDIIFALNWELHPGEKRLLDKTLLSCKKLPENFEPDLLAVLGSSGSSNAGLLASTAELLDHLDELLIQEGFGASDG